MDLIAISRFVWRGKTYEIGEPITCPDDVIGNRLISEGNAKQEPAAITHIEKTAGTFREAEISMKAPVVSKKKVSKKKIRQEVL